MQTRHDACLLNIIGNSVRLLARRIVLFVNLKLVVDAIVVVIEHQAPVRAVNL